MYEPLEDLAVGIETEDLPLLRTAGQQLQFIAICLKTIVLGCAAFHKGAVAILAKQKLLHGKEVCAAAQAGNGIGEEQPGKLGKLF